MEPEDNQKTPQVGELSVEKQEITYSPAFTLVPTYECFNRCAYCNFRKDPGEDRWLSVVAAQSRLQALSSPTSMAQLSHLGTTSQKALKISQNWDQNLDFVQPNVTEVLILSGEVHPKSPRRVAWLDQIMALCEVALELGFLPHTNVGPLSFEEMRQLRAVNVSMGLMLEQMTPRLLETVHRHAPSKRPELRLQQLRWAGELQIPFTTGLLLGIGEDRAERIETLEAIAQVHAQWGHIQEVILQPHSPGNHQLFSAEACDADTFLDTIALARKILPPDVVLQIPPNLVQTPALLRACIEAGARDLGGIGPVDEVNPDYQHPALERLQQELAIAHYQLAPRLPVHKRYLDWLPKPLKHQCQSILAAWQLDREQTKVGAVVMDRAD